MKINETAVVGNSESRHVIIVALAEKADKHSSIVSRYRSRLFEAAALPSSLTAEHKTLAGAMAWAKKTVG